MVTHNVLPISGMLKPCHQTSSLPQGLKTLTLLQRYPFLLPLTLQYINIQKYFSLKIHQDDLASPTHETFCLLCGLQRDLLTPPPVEKIRTGESGDGGEGGGVTSATNDVTVAERGEGWEER